MTLNDRRIFRRYRVQATNPLTAFQHGQRAGVHAPCAELISKCGSKPTSPTQTAINFPKSRLHGVYSSAIVSTWRTAKENSMKNVFLSHQRNLSLAFPFIFIIDSKDFRVKSHPNFSIVFSHKFKRFLLSEASLSPPERLKLCKKQVASDKKKVFHFLLFCFSAHVDCDRIERSTVFHRGKMKCLWR